MTKNKLFSLLMISVFTILISCNNQGKEQKKDENKIQYITKGKEIAKESFTALSGELKAAMSEGGVQHAAAYCNLKALPIIDSLSEVHNVSIRRASDRVRNSEDLADRIESEMIDQYNLMIFEGKELSPQLVEGEDGSVSFFAPIVINTPLCLACHGEPGVSISQPDYDYIKSLYPADAAIGYKEGELRGVWHIKFNN